MTKLYDKELPIIETERLILKKFRKNEIELYAKKSCLINANYFRNRTFDSEVIRINSYLESFEEVGNPLLWSIELKETQKLIGEIEIMHVGEQCIPNVPLNLSVFIFDEYQKQGFGYETVKNLLDYISKNFKEYIEFDSITVVVNETNEASTNLFMEKYLGFEHLLYTNNHPLLKYGYPNSHILVKNLFASLNFMQEVFHHNERYKLTEDNKEIFAEAQRLLKNQSYNDAIDLYTKIVRTSYSYSYAYYERGLCYEKIGRLDRAFPDYQKASISNPYYGQAYHKIGFILQEWGNHTMAIRSYSMAIDINPNDTTSLFNRLILYAKNNQLNLALKDAESLSNLGDEEGKRFKLILKQQLGIIS